MAVTKYTEKLAAQICDAIATSKGSLESILKENGIKIQPRTVYNWLLKHEGFRTAYEKAREFQAELWFEEMIKIAYDATNDVISDGKGGFIPNPAAVQRARVIIDTLKFAMSKLFPKRYGERVEQKIAELQEKLGKAINDRK